MAARKKTKKSSVKKTRSSKPVTHHKKAVWRQPVDPFLAWGIIAVITLVGIFALRPEFFVFAK